MQLCDLLQLVNQAYPGRVLENHFNLSTGASIPEVDGDSLALFVGRELIDTFDETATREVQIEEARRVIASAINDLCAVADGLC